MVSLIASILASNYANLGLFIIMIFASGIPIPVIGTLIISFGAAVTSIKSLIFLIALVYIATLIGDFSVYFIARHFSKPVLKFVKRFKWFKKNNTKVQNMLDKYGFSIVFFSRFFVTESCLVVNYIAGFERFDYRKFIPAVILGEFVYAVYFCSIGYILRDTWNYMFGIIQNFFFTIISVAIEAYVVYRIIKLVRT